MTFAEISQAFAVTSSLTAADETQKQKAKEDLLEADERILAIAQRKPFIAIMSANEKTALEKAKADLGITR